MTASFAYRVLPNATGSGAMVGSTVKISAPAGGRLLIKEVRLTLSAAGGTSENFTATINSGLGSAYDNQVFSQDMVSTQFVRIEFDHLLLNGKDVPGGPAVDELQFAYANTGGRTWGLEIIGQAV